MKKHLSSIEKLLDRLAGQQAMPDDSWKAEWAKIKCGIEKGEEHSVSILWGQNPELDEREPQTYSFGTEAELDAFLEGVDAMDGWMDYQIVEEDEV